MAISSTTRDLFRSLEQAIKDYTGEAFAGYDAADVEGLLKDRLQQGREKVGRGPGVSEGTVRTSGTTPRYNLILSILLRRRERQR